MKFKLKENAIDILSPTPVEDYLRSLGITKPESFIVAPSEEDEETYKSIYNLKEGLEMFHKHIERRSSIFLQVD